MSSNKNMMNIFIMPQQFPCGPEASCCGPVGITDEELQNLVAALKGEFGLPIEIVDTTEGKLMRNHPQILRLVRSLGHMALPTITIDDDIVSIGNYTTDKVINAIKDKLRQT